MPNDLIHVNSRLPGIEPYRARLYLFSVIVALAGLATQVPRPGDLLRDVTGDLPTNLPSSVTAYLEWILLAAAGMAVWTLIAWTTLILLATTMNALAPGRLSSRATGLLTHCLPSAARQVLIVAVGFGAVAGLTACGPGSPVPTAGFESAQASTTSSAVAASGSVDSTSSWPKADWTTAAPSGWDLDWPSTGTTPNGESFPATAISPPNATDSGQTANDAAADGGPIVAAPVSTPTQTPTQTPAPTANSTGTTAIDLDWPTAPAELVEVGADPAQGDITPLDPAGSDLAEITADPDPTAPLQPLGPVTVLPGDSLWSIAAAQLPPDSTDEKIDSSWRAWYLTNQTLVGSDPNLLEIGWVLMPPPA